MTFLKKMSKAGCKIIHYGVESGPPKIFESTEKRITITVNNLNRAPYLALFEPADTLIQVQEDQRVLFRVEAADDDGDSLSYAWYLDEMLLPGKVSRLEIIFTESLKDLERSVVRISDRDTTIEHVWKIDFVTLVSSRESIPTRLALGQNYPNPFNPTTRIQFEIPRPEKIRLIIYNTGGQEIKTLCDNELPAGVYEILWDATNDAGLSVTSGMYYYRLYAGDQVLTRKVLFLK